MGLLFPMIGGGEAKPIAANLKAWFRADTLTGADNSTLTGWPDSGTLGNNVTAVSTPKLRTGANGKNGKNVVELEGVTSYFTRATPNLPAGNSGWTVFEVFKILAAVPGSGSALATISWGGSAFSGNVRFVSFYNYSGNVIRDRFISGQKSYNNPTSLQDTWVVKTSYYPGGTTIDNVAMRLNGVALTATGDHSALNFGTTQLAIGNVATDPSIFTIAHIQLAEFLIYDAGLSLPQIVTEEARLRSKWAF